MRGTDRLSQNAANTKFVSNQIDGLKLITAAFRHLNWRRRSLLVTELPKSWRCLASHNTPATDYLFGDDLPKQLKEMSDINKFADELFGTGKSAARNKQRSNGFRGSHGGGHGYYNNGNFLASRGSWNNRGPQYNNNNQYNNYGYRNQNNYRARGRNNTRGYKK